jgi:phage terminase large subunit GpA-like protein
MKIPAIRKAIKNGLGHLFRGEKLTAVEHADKFFYMSSESSYIEGDWETAPSQIAILNAMGNDLIREVNWIKSARTGYTKLICAVASFFVEHKKRHVACWAPDDGARDRFSKKHIDMMIRDVKPLRKLFPWFGQKHKNNTIEQKSFSNRKELYLLGGKASKNYREISVDVVILDELSKFDRDIEGEGSPNMLSDKRNEGSAFRKMIRGSSPGILGQCLISEVADQADHFFRRKIPCPCCGVVQVLKFGTPESKYGLKWGNKLPKIHQGQGVKYQCESCEDYFTYSQFVNADYMGYWESEQGLLTYDGIIFYDSDDMSVSFTPESVAFHLWTAYSHFSNWDSIKRDFNKIKGNRNRLKTFINTTLGEAFEDDVAAKLSHEILYGMRERYKAQVPSNAYYITAGYDMQDNRVEGTMWAYGMHGEKFLVDTFVVFGNPEEPAMWDALELVTRRKYKHETGNLLPISKVCFDTGGHNADKVHAFSRRMGVDWVLCCRGSSQYNKPIATMNKTKDLSRKTYMVMIGTDNSKDELFGSFNIKRDEDLAEGSAIPGMTHFPANDMICNKNWFEQFCNEHKIWKVVNRKRVRVYTTKYEGARNEALDCTVYANAAYYCALQYFGLNMQQLKDSFDMMGRTVSKPKRKNKAGTVSGGL